MSIVLFTVDIEDLSAVLSAIKDSLSAEWKRFALELGIRQSTVETAECTRHGQPRDCLHDILVEWLKLNYDHHEHRRPSWRRLASAVRQLDGALFENLVREHPL